MGHWSWFYFLGDLRNRNFRANLCKENQGSKEVARLQMLKRGISLFAICRPSPYHSEPTFGPAGLCGNLNEYCLEMGLSERFQFWIKTLWLTDLFSVLGALKLGTGTAAVLVGPGSTCGSYIYHTNNEIKCAGVSKKFRCSITFLYCRGIHFLYARRVQMCKN